MRKVLTIRGMSCMHCVAHVQNALKDLSGVADAKASLDDERAVVVVDDDVGDDSLKEAIAGAGYEVVKIENQ